jgi:hypothetical protein
MNTARPWRTASLAVALLLWLTAAPTAQLAHLWSFDELRTSSDLAVVAAWVDVHVIDHVERPTPD